MKFVAFGLNHETASLEVSERFFLDDASCKKLVEDVSDTLSSELVILSTCNRTECYLYGNEADAALLRERIAQTIGMPWPHEHSFQHIDEEAVRHILQVTAGTRSLVPGDGQILAQMKDAYERAVDAGTVDMVMHRLMHTAFRAAKRVSRETNLAAGAASVSSAAIALADAYFQERSSGGLKGKEILFIGAGEMGELALQAAMGYSPHSIFVTNRSPERAQKVTDNCCGSTIPWKDRFDAISMADLVLVATGAPEPIVHASDLTASDGCLVVDIARPRNVAANVDELSGYEVRDLDDLQQWISKVEEARREELPSAEQICEELLGDFVSWVFHQEALQPAIDSIRSTFEHIRLQEIQRHAHRFTGADRDELHLITKSILQKLLAVPIVRLKNVDPDNMDFVRGIKLLSMLFDRSGAAEAENSASDRCPFGEQGNDASDSSDSQLDIEQLRRILSTLEHRETSE